MTRLCCRRRTTVSTRMIPDRLRFRSITRARLIIVVAAVVVGVVKSTAAAIPPVALATITLPRSFPPLSPCLRNFPSPSRRFASGGADDSVRAESTASVASSDCDSDSDSDSNSAAATTTLIYLDVAVSSRPVGRLVFHLPDPNPLPLHASNVIELCRGSRRSIDPAATYENCAFSYSPQCIEGMAQYRWGHVLPGRGRNAVGPVAGRIEEPDEMRACQRSAFGGSYYGLRYRDIPGAEVVDEVASGGAVALTVPLSGPGRGSSCLSVVRVGESPREWGERLLMNSAVLGWMDPSCGDVLRAMARQRVGPPVVVAAGVLGDGEE